MLCMPGSDANAEEEPVHSAVIEVCADCDLAKEWPDVHQVLRGGLHA